VNTSPHTSSWRSAYLNTGKHYIFTEPLQLYSYPSDYQGFASSCVRHQSKAICWGSQGTIPCGLGSSSYSGCFFYLDRRVDSHKGRQAGIGAALSGSYNSCLGFLGIGRSLSTWTCVAWWPPACCATCHVTVWRRTSYINDTLSGMQCCHPYRSLYRGAWPKWHNLPV
jgi:hypothetical protein